MKTFNPGKVIIKEGESSDYAYIVKKGELKMISNQVPVVIK